MKNIQNKRKLQLVRKSGCVSHINAKTSDIINEKRKFVFENLPITYNPRQNTSLCELWVL